MNNTYLYDGTFEGLASLIVNLLYMRLTPIDIKCEDKYDKTLFDEGIHLHLDNTETLLKQFSNNIPPQIWKTVYHIFLASATDKELVIYYFLKNSLKYKMTIYYQRNLKCVNRAEELEKNVKRENHKLKGFLRFKEMNNQVLYAEMAPTNDIITLLAPHFARRLKNEYFLIKDVKREKYAFYDKKNIKYLTKKDIVSLDLKITEQEENFEELWKSFFKTIGIKERENKKVQQNFMPKKYWKYIIEMED